MPRLGLHVTDRCQLDCAHCLRDPARKPRDLPVPLIARLLPEARALAIDHCSLTGGEPTLHPELRAVVDVIVASGMTWDVVTNGRRFDRFLEMVEGERARGDALRLVVISVDGAAEETHDAVRGRGSYREALGAAAACGATGIRFGLQMTVHGENVHEVEAMAELGRALGANHVSYAMMQPTGTAHDERLAMPLAEWDALHSRLRRLRSTAGVQIVLAEGWPAETPEDCGPVRGQTIHVDVDGYVSLCCLQTQVPGPDRGRVQHVAAGLESASVPLLALRREASAARRGAIGPWARYGCNSCLAHFGKPSWTDTGATGPSAIRERWRGAWPRSGQATPVRLRIVQ